jgi:hypothetical protein
MVSETADKEGLLYIKQFVLLLGREMDVLHVFV